MSELSHVLDLAPQSIVGVDIGGANLKYALACQGHATSSKSHSRFFELWKRPDELVDILTEDIGAFEGIDALAVTMTGELADCFLDRAVGVEHIVRHTALAASNLGISDLRFYRVDGLFCDARQATDEPDSVAAGNWHAMAAWAAGEIASDGLLVDIGSTTADIIPLVGGKVATPATTDFGRLKDHQLVYVGCRRTPVCALIDSFVFRGDVVDVMNEWFATIDDARIVLGVEPEAVDDLDSADGKPRTIAMSANRLARMIGLDHRSVTVDDAKELAVQITYAARQRINAAVSKVWNGESPVILSGHAPDLVDLSPGHRVVKLSELVGQDLSRCGPAYAVAQLRMAASTESAY